MLSLDVDLIQRVKVAGIFLLQVYKVTTGTMLSLFIPQACDNGQICSLKQNYENSDGYHQTVFYWNAFSMITFFTYYMVVSLTASSAIEPPTVAFKLTL